MTCQMDGCDTVGRLYPGGRLCDRHAPWSAASRPDPDTLVDPTLTLTALNPGYVGAPSGPPRTGRHGVTVERERLREQSTRNGR